MKKMLFIIGMATIMFACDGAKNQQANESEVEENMDENSAEPISPETEIEEADTMQVDTVSSSGMEDQQN